MLIDEAQNNATLGSGMKDFASYEYIFRSLRELFDLR